MPIILSDQRPEDPRQREWWYNSLDAAVTLELAQKLLAKPGGDSVYTFERALQGPALDMMLNGFRIDRIWQRRMMDRLEARLDLMQERLDRLAFAIAEKPLNPRSSPQVKEFFYEIMGLPEIWTSKKGVRSLSADREALEKLSDYYLAAPIVNLILAARDCSKKLGVLRTGVDPDGRMRCTYNVCGTETGRWASSQNVFGRGCVLPSAEALTLSGWKRVDQITDGELIAQYTCNGKIEFVPTTMFSTEFSGDLLQVKTEQTQLTVTPGHRVLHYDSRMEKRYTTEAMKVAERSQVVLPLGGKHNGDLEYPAYLAMLMADFSKEHGSWRGAFKKQRKIERFFKLAAEFGFEWNAQSSKEGYQRFRVAGLQDFPKKWGAWILNLSLKSAQALLEEARHWDSHDRGSGFIFYSAEKEQAEWFATLAHLCGKSATIRQTEQNPGSYSTTTIWCVNVKDRDFARVQRKHWNTIPYAGTVYCPQVPSSYWLVRDNGYISVTGNTNLQNVTDELRRIFVADPGYVILYVDGEQAESRSVGFIHGIRLGDWRYLDACESGDLHTLVTKMVWPNLPWTGDAKADREIADRNFYRWFSYRDMAKRGGHGTSYYGQPFTMARHLKVPPKLIEDFQRPFKAAFAFERWWQWVQTQLATTQSITTFVGRERTFFGRPNDDSTLRKAIAYEPQSTVGDLINEGGYRVWKKFCLDPERNVMILGQIHDAFLFQIRETHLHLIPEILETFSVPVVHPTRTLRIPAEAKVGWNWGSCEMSKPVEKRNHKDGNPDGLDKWKGRLDRKRKESPTDSLLDRILY